MGLSYYNNTFYCEKTKKDFKKLINRAKRISIELILAALEPAREILNPKS